LAYINFDPQLESFVESMSEQLNFILMKTKSSSSSLSRNSFDIYPSYNLICTAFSDLVNYFQWKHAAIFYNLDTSKLNKCLLLSNKI
jgi:hypothetical protein